MRMMSHDPTICLESPATTLLSATDPPIPKAHYPAVTTRTFIENLSRHGKQSFCTTGKFERDTVGKAFRLDDRGRVAQYDIASTGFFVRSKLGSRPLKLVTCIPEESTRKGIPKWIKKLDDSSREDAQAALDERIRASERDKYILAGNDLGIRVSQAIHLNEMSEENDTAGNESKTFLLKPHGLQEISRRSVFIKQRLRERIPVNTLRLLEAQQSKQELNEYLLSAYNLVDQCLKSSREYCHRSFRHVQQSRRFQDKVASQFIRTAWPNPDQPKVPMLFAIGDGCGWGNEKVQKHHADFSTSELRHLIKRLKTQSYPIEFILVDESFTSQVCPDPKCKDEEGYRSK